MNPPLRPRWRLLPAVLPLAVLAACAGQQQAAAPGSRAAASPQTVAACRQRADEVYDRQNRADVYTSDMYAGGLRDSPFAGREMAGLPNRGLSSRYARDTMLDDCLRSAAGNIETAPDAPAPAGALPAPPPPPPRR